MISNWEISKAKSNYHFDSKRIDQLSDVIQILGHVDVTWQNELNDIVAQAKPATWESFIPENWSKFVANDLISYSAGLGQALTHINNNIPNSLIELSDKFALGDCMTRIHVQKPGEMWNLHIDKLQQWAPDNPKSVMRIMIQLTDWQPGQFWQYGNHNYHQWSAGDVTAFDWINLPHSTANAGYHNRVTLQLTGIVTEQTQEFLKLIGQKI